MKKIFIIVAILALFFGGPIYVLLSDQLVLNQHWQTADRSSAHIAPLPADHPAALIQIYMARAYGWRGMFAIHTWIAIKWKNAKSYIVYQVLGWNLLRGKPALDSRKDLPDRAWFGHRPTILYSISGEKAEAMIPVLQEAIRSYPYKTKYQPLPGPNSNTFTAYVIRHTAMLKLRLPVTAIGKDYFNYAHCAQALSKSGTQCSLKGLLGFTLAKVEGIEINLLGFSFALNTTWPFLHLPGID